MGVVEIGVADKTSTDRREKPTALWLIGEGRSGTTWVWSLFNHGRQYRPLFEPFHPGLADCAFLEPHRYVRPGDEHSALAARADRVFADRCNHPRVARDGRRTGGAGSLLVKDIFANLFAFWLVDRLPHVHPVLLLRNPFEVALSKARRPTWFWMDEPSAFLADERLVDDHLAPYVPIIERHADDADFIVRQVLIWSVVNLVPLRQFAYGRLDVLFYEEVVAAPAASIHEVHGRQVEPLAEIDADLVARPSIAGASPASGNGPTPRTAWRSQLTPHQLRSGEEILAAFGLGGLYGRAGRPDRRVIDALRPPPRTS